MTTAQLIMNCFTQTKPCIYAHVHGLKYHRHDYLDQLQHYRRNPIMWDSVSHAIKARIFAALHLCKEHKEVEEILPHLDITDIEKACCNILDRPRQARQIQKKIAALERQHPHHLEEEVKSDDEIKEEMKDDEHMEEGDGKEEQARPKRPKSLRKIMKLRRMLQEIQESPEFGGGAGANHHHHHQTEPCATAHDNSAVQELIQSASVSGSLADKIRKRFKSQKSDFLEYVMLTMPTKAWKKVADLVHFHPQDFAVPYFLADVFGEAIPEESFVFSMRKLSKTTSGDEAVERYRDMAQKFPQLYDAYAYLRTMPTMLHSKDVVEDLATKIPLDLVIWYFEELHGTSNTCSKILEDRLKEEGVLSNAINTSPSKVYTYGKLLERILTFRRQRLSQLEKLLIQMATIRLKFMKEQASSNANHNAKTVVFGDASSSMQRAIEAATIFAAMASVCMNGELSFFESRLLESPHKKPVTVEETLEVCTKVQATGCTSLAAALWPYYEKKEHVDIIIMVTDEGENTNWNGYTFAKLLHKYKEEVNPDVAFVVVCVGNGDHRFRKSLVENGIVWKTVTIDGQRPDLTKFDTLLGEIVLIANSLLVVRTSSQEEGEEKIGSAEDVENDGGGEENFVFVE